MPVVAFSVEPQVQLRATQRKREAAEKMRAWRAAQSAEDKERRRVRITRQENRRVEDERIARRQRFRRLSASDQEEIRARDRYRHKRLRVIMMKLRKAKEIRDADDREEVARAIAAGEAAADAASSSSSDADETVKKKKRQGEQRGRAFHCFYARVDRRQIRLVRPATDSATDQARSTALVR